MDHIKLELEDGKFKLSKKNKHTWSFIYLSESELDHIMKHFESVKGIDTTGDKGKEEVI